MFNSCRLPLKPLVLFQLSLQDAYKLTLEQKCWCRPCLVARTAVDAAVVAAKSDIEEFKTDLDAARLERQHKEEYEELRRQCMKAGSGDSKQSG